MGRLVEIPIPGMFGGVSRQPDAIRPSNTVQKMTNCLPSIVTGGFERRPGLTFISELYGANKALDYKVHFIDRDNTDQIILLISDSSILMFNAQTGAPITIDVEPTSCYLHVDSTGLDGGVGVLTDTTTGKSVFGPYKQVSAPETPTYSWRSNDATWTFKVEQSADGVSGWTDWITGETGGSGSGSAALAASSQYFRVNITGAGTPSATDTFSFELTFPTWQYIDGIVKADAALTSVADFTFFTNRTYSKNGVDGTRLKETESDTALTGTVQAWGSLPAASGTGNVYRIVGTGDKDNRKFREYYVIDDAADAVWKEHRTLDEQHDWMLMTMPHQIAKQTDGTYHFGPAQWKQRTVGSVALVPAPTFLGKQIKDLFYYRSRLGVLADEQVYLGEVNDALDFWPRKSTEVLDSDPIDRTVATTKVSKLQWGTVLRKVLFLTAPNAQFELTALDKMTPNDAVMDKTTGYSASLQFKPIQMGDTIIFVADQGLYSSVYEYEVDERSVGTTAANISKHVPGYIPINVEDGASSEEVGWVGLLTDLQDGGEGLHGGITFGSPVGDAFRPTEDTTHTKGGLYCYNRFDDGQERLQSAWHRWEYATGPDGTPTTANDFSILGCEVMNDILILVWSDQRGVYLGHQMLEREREGAEGEVFGNDSRPVFFDKKYATNNGATWGESIDGAVIGYGSFSIQRAPYEDRDGYMRIRYRDSGDKEFEIIPTPLVHGQLSGILTDCAELSLSGVTAGTTIDVGGNTYTAHATTTTVANREFSIAGTDAADMTELATVLNDATYGVQDCFVNFRSELGQTGRVQIVPNNPYKPTQFVVDNIGSGITLHTNDHWYGFVEGLTNWVILGQTYRSEAVLNRLFMREGGAPEGIALTNGRFQMRDITFDWGPTTHGFSVTVNYDRRARGEDPTVTQETTRDFRYDDFNTEHVAGVQGSFRVPVKTESRKAKITIHAGDTGGNFVITGAKYRGMYSEKARAG